MTATKLAACLPLTLVALFAPGCDADKQGGDDLGDAEVMTTGVDEGPDTDADPDDDEPADPSATTGPSEPPPADTGPAEVETCDEEAASRPCAGDGFDGTQYCAPVGESGSLVWGTCLEWVECEPGEFVHCGFCPGEEGTGGLPEEECPGFGDQCRLVGDTPTSSDGDESECNTPLVLSFDGGPVQMSAVPAAAFDINATGQCLSTDWPSAETPWLALDLDRSGSIESGRELFGSGTRHADGHRARNGFEALALLDDNGDGRIDGADARFAELLLWGDEDADKAATHAELTPVSMRGLLSIDLGYRVDRRCDDRGNCEVERASFTYVDRGGEVRTGEIIDIHLACQ